MMSSRYEGPETEEGHRERDRAEAGELPERYAEPWGRPFFAEARRALTPGACILDVGAGRHPTLPANARPAGGTYVGLDISAAELRAAGAGAYDEIVAADVGQPRPEFAERFDLVLSWQVLEHVDSMQRALATMHTYLKPGGIMVAQVSGSFAVFALLARVIPYSLSNRLMQRLLGTAAEDKFPTRYDRCYASALESLLDRWSDHRIVPRYKGAGYFRFSRRLERGYLSYEDWIARTGRRNLATHYVICGIK